MRKLNLTKILTAALICFMVASCNKDEEEEKPKETVDCKTAVINEDLEELDPGGSFQFTATVDGGVWAVVSGIGTIDQTGLYSSTILTEQSETGEDIAVDVDVKISYTLAAGFNDTDCVESVATDDFIARVNCIEADITIFNDPLYAEETHQFESTPSGGVWAVVSGGGTIDEATGLYTAAESITADTDVKISYTLPAEFQHSACPESIKTLTFQVNAPYANVSPNGVIKAAGGAKVGDILTIGNDTYTVVDDATIKDEIAKGNKVITTLVKNMDELFKDKTNITADVTKWDTSNVTSMEGMFEGATTFNQPISDWDTGNVTNMDNMFKGAAAFDQNIGDWDTKSVTSMVSTFEKATAFNQDISKWDVSKVTDNTDYDIETNPAWKDAHKPKNFSDALPHATIDPTTGVIKVVGDAIKVGDIFNIDGVDYTVVDNATIKSEIANGNAANIITTLVTNMDELFQDDTSFNEDISKWDTSNVTSMVSTFEGATAFDKDISKWDVANVTDNTDFDVDTNPTWLTAKKPSFPTSLPHATKGTDGVIKGEGDIKVGDVFNIDGVDYTVVDKTGLQTAIANGTTDKVITTLVTDMDELFKGNTTFNEDISSWDTSSVTNMDNMFEGATAFKQDISKWDVANVTENKGFAVGTGVTPTPWTTDNRPTFPTALPHAMVDPNNVTIKGVGAIEAGDIYNINGIDYTVVDKTGLQTAIAANDGSVTKVITTLVTNLDDLLNGKSTFNEDISSWDTSNVTSMVRTFEYASGFNQDIGNWDVSNVTTMLDLFQDAYAFNQDINNWDVTSVENLNGTFARATSFNKPLNNWKTSSLNTLSNTFKGAADFNQPLSNWDVSQVTVINQLFQELPIFNQDLSGWDFDAVLPTNRNNWDYLTPSWQANFKPTFSN